MCVFARGYTFGARDGQRDPAEGLPFCDIGAVTVTNGYLNPRFRREFERFADLKLGFQPSRPGRPVRRAIPFGKTDQTESFVVSQGKADTAISTEGFALIASAAVLVAVMLAAVGVAAVRRRARSTPAIMEVKHTVPTPDPVAPGLSVV